MAMKILKARIKDALLTVVVHLDTTAMLDSGIPNPIYLFTSTWSVARLSKFTGGPQETNQELTDRLRSEIRLLSQERLNSINNSSETISPLEGVTL